MRKVLFLLPLLGGLVSVQACRAESRIEDGLYLIYEGEETLTGLEHYRDQKRNGFVFEYFPDGGVKRVLKYKDDLLNGLSRGYYPGGRLRFRKFYVNGLLDGTVQQYYEDGTLKLEAEFADDLPHGEARFYSPRGVLQESVTYVHGRITHIRKYDDKGAVIQEGDVE